MRTGFLAILICFLTATSARAQTADTAFIAAIAAHGGGSLSVVQSLIMRGHSVRDGAREPVVISASLDGKLRIDYGSPSDHSEVLRPAGGFRIASGKTTWLSPHVGAYAQLDLLSAFGILHLANGIEKTVLGPGSVAGRPTARVKAVTGRDQVQYRRLIKDEAEVQFDTETALVAAISRTQYADESLDLAFTMTTTFSDYRPHAGFVLPFKISRYINGILKETFTVDSIDINPAFAPETFGR
jgi:hypothetical protein